MRMVCLVLLLAGYSSGQEASEPTVGAEAGEEHSMVIFEAKIAKDTIDIKDIPKTHQQ